MTTATYVLEIDFNANGVFTDANEDVTGDVLIVECSRGRDYASQLIGRASAGRLTAILRNDDGKYSSFNAASPLTGNLLPGRKVRFKTTAPSAQTLWTGFLDRIEPQVQVGPFNTARLYASGPFIKLAGPNAKVSPDAQNTVPTGTIIGKILDAADWPAGDRTVDTGDVMVGRWYAEEKEALELLREIEDTEVGFVYEGLAWDVIFEARYNRIINHLTSQATFSDAVGAARPYVGIDQLDPLREIFNEVVVMIQPYHTNALAVLWTLTNETPVLAAAASRIYIAQYPNPSSGGAQGAYVDAWTTPVVGTDITQVGVANGDIAVSVVKKATTMEITITNNHLTAAATLTLVQARGTAVIRDNPFKLTKSDATSQTKFGKRSYPSASPWYFNSAYAEGTADYIISRQKDPQPVLTLEIGPNRDSTMMTEALSRKISDRVTVVAQNNAELGINRDFYIEAIHHRLDQGTRHQTVFELSTAETDPAYWILGVDELGVGTKLGY